MFQPISQTAPHPAPFATYGVGASIPDFAGYPPAGGLVLDSGSPTLFRDPIFSPVPNTNASGGLPFNNPSTQHYKMETNGVGDMEAQEALAREFQPSLEGLLVGEKKSSHAIAVEYEKADPVYVAKTAALPQKYSHYRQVLGDGNCGWRAAGFSYFETLLRLRSKAQLREEISRMTSLNNLLTTVGGFEAWLFEDMVEETTDLLRDLANLVQSQPEAADNLLIKRFNNPEVSNAIVYHFRLLASSWLKGSPTGYQDFIPDGLGVDGYRKDWLEPPNQEIDHLGMTLLIDVLLKPIGIAVEIVYLDRSVGTQVNTHVIQDEDSNGVPTNPGGPMIHLLYRPSHYDILYNDMDSSIPLRQQADKMVQNPNVQVHRANGFSHEHDVKSTTSTMHDFSTLDLATLLSIPGFVMPPQSSHHGFPSQFRSPIEPTYSNSPMSASISSISPGPSTTTTSSSASLTTNFPPPHANLASPSITTSHVSFPSPTTLPIHSHPMNSHNRASLPSDLSSPCSATSSFRPSKYEWEAAADWQEGPAPTFQTSTFKNSHYNTAHYNNPNFQPEEWSPDCEEVSSGRKRSG